MFQLVYSSKAKWDLSEDDLADILLGANRFNLAHGVTGLLLYSRRSFLQVLEGEIGDVGDAFRRIGKSLYHYDVEVRSTLPVADRLFPGWWMDFARPSLRHPFTRYPLTSRRVVPDGEAAIDLLVQYASGGITRGESTDGR